MFSELTKKWWARIAVLITVPVTLIINAADFDDIITTAPQDRGPIMTGIIGVINWIWRSIGSDYFSGFMIAIFLLVLWNLPQITKLIAKIREKKRNIDADNRLADECDDISKYLYEEAAALQRLRTELFWQSAKGGSEDRSDQWIEARRREAREEERISRHIGSRINSLFVEFRNRKMKLELWHFSLRQHELTAASYFFAEIAKSLRNGDYMEKEFKVDPWTVPPQM